MERLKSSKDGPEDRESISEIGGPLVIDYHKMAELGNREKT